MTSLLKQIVENGDKVTLNVFLLIALMLILYGVFLGVIRPPRDTKELKERCSKTEVVLDKTAAELADSRILHAQAAIKLEYMERDLRREHDENTMLRERVARLEQDLAEIRTWQRETLTRKDL